MTYGPDALQAEIGRIVGIEGPVTVRALVESLGGTRAAAGQLNVAQRTVERYINREEHGVTKSNRQISQTQRLLLEDAVARKQVHELVDKVGKAGGLSAEAPGEFRISDKLVQRDVRTYSGPIPVSNLNGMFNAIQDGNWDAAWSAFERELFASYGVGADGNNHFEGGQVDYVALAL